MSNKKKSLTLAAAVLAVALVLAGLFLVQGGPGRPPAGGPAAPGAEARRGLEGRAAPQPAAGTPGAELSQDAMVADLRARYGARLSSAHVQVKMLEKLIRYFRTRFPERWEQELLDLLRVAFPDRYVELAQNLKRWVEYERWMDEQRTVLQGLEEKERRAAIQEARERIFGKELAETLWTSERKNQAVVETLRAVDAQVGASVQDRLSAYKQGLEDVYEEQTEGYLERHRQEVMDRFLDLSSVQEELGALSSEERAKSLKEIRRGLGLSEEALQRWEVLDTERDQRWEAGKQYMQEREALARQFSGATLEERLQELRARHFGAEADTIAAEEQGGFFRFSRPRRWGRN